MGRGRTERRWRLVRARREAVPASVRRMHQRIRRPRLRSGKLWLVGTLALVVLAASSWVVWFTSVLGVRHIEVAGSQIVGADQIRAVAAVVDGTPLARVDTDAVGRRILSLPSVADVAVSRSWPNTLTIEVTERVPLAVVAVGRRFVVIDADGVVFNTVTARPAGVIVLRVASPGPDDPATRAALAVLAALTPTLRGQVTALVAESSTRIRLELTGGRIVLWGSTEQSETKAKVATSLLPRPGRTIDVSAPEVATVSG